MHWLLRVPINVSLFLTLPASLLAGDKQAATATNPILPGFNPDPSACRVGDNYYLATSTFEYFPGVPIYQSKDLVSWRRIGHVLSTRNQLDLTGVLPAAGIYAPTLRFHDGVYYMITTMIGSPIKKGIFVVTATNPSGPWSLPHWIEDAPGIDPSLFFDDDGSVYLCANTKPENPVNEKHRDIWIRKLNLETFQLEGPEGILESAPYFASGKLGSVSNFEAPHLYKKDGAYYLMLAHGGTGLNHAVSIWRSTGPLGPWEENPANPILTHRGEHPAGLTCTGHADLVQTRSGQWWMVLLGVRDEKGQSPMGRETFLVPVEWSGTWPVVNPGSNQGRVDLVFPRPDLPAGEPSPTGFRDDFDKPKLSFDWSFIRTPLTSWWDLQRKPGWLSLQLRSAQLTGNDQPSFLGIRVTQSTCRARTKVLFQPKDENGCAGLSILRNASSCFMLVVERKGGERVASVYQGSVFRASTPILKSGAVDLGIDLKNDRLSFFVKAGSDKWILLHDLDASFLSTDPGGRFRGTMIGLYASSRGKESAETASFDFFDYSVQKP